MEVYNNSIITTHIYRVLVKYDPITLFLNQNLITGTTKFIKLECYWIFSKLTIKLLLPILESIRSINASSYLFFQLTEVTENLTHVSSEYGKLLSEKEQIERTMKEHICQQLEKITSLNKAKDELQQIVETCKAERDQLKADCQESKERVCIKSLK